MSRDQLRHIQMLIETGQIEAAREYLEANAEDPTIQKMLDDFNEHYPPPQSEIADLLELGGERDQKMLAQARHLLQNNRFADARKLLTQLQHMPKARQWLEELNELEAELRREAQEAANARNEPFSAAQAFGDFVRSSNFRILIGASIIIVAVIVIIGFFTFNITESNITLRLTFLKDIQRVDITEPTACTAFAIWRGETTCQHTFALDTEAASRSERTGFVAVRSLDRLLIGMPVAALVIIALAWAYITETFDSLMVLIAIAGVGIFLLLFPVVWQSMSADVGTNEDIAHDQLADSLDAVVYLDYNVTEHMILTGLIVGLCIVALLIMMAELAGMFGVPRNLLTARGELEPDLMKLYEERKRLGR